MNSNLQVISHQFAESVIEQRIKDGFINATAMCKANGKEMKDWLKNQDTYELFFALNIDIFKISNQEDSPDLDISRLSTTKYSKLFPNLIFTKRGNPEIGGGTWLHPDLALQLAQWCNKSFAIQVSKWIRQWMTTGQNPLADIDRVNHRDQLKDQARLNMTDQIKMYLEQIQKYDDKKFRGQYFAKVHDLINKAITTETSKQMRLRLSEILGRDVKDNELIRDYFPSVQLQQYTAICNVVANLMYKDCLHPLDAVNQAVGLVLPINYVPMPINFVEHIKLTRQRVAEYVLDARRENLYRSLADK